MKTIAASILAGLAANVAAHGIVTKITIGTKTYQGYDPNFQYMPTPPAVIGWTAPLTQDRGPVDGNKLNDPDIICQRGATNAGTISAPVAAGDSVSLQWTPWPESHHGPVLDYLADCGGDCSTVDKTTLKFFKIDGVGMTSTAGSPPNFADDDMIKNNNTWTVKIPSDIAPGNYVLRHETIALHQAQAVGGSQPYPQCINLQITGSGTAKPDGVLGTELYKATDPGIQFNIYTTFTNTNQYPVPGPTLYSGAAGAGGVSAPAATASSVAAASSAAAPAGTTTKASAVSSSTPAATGGAGCKVKRWHAKDFSM
ncbi:uncharacterized protein PV09_09245 [Verruconis gallopava]|uniref:Auxiliary Activity family 9 catalytic domain-containing protein n=1 Tax=Verruconis gallopava TaxID=253628 RepID=A0A0D1YEB1_9PEZI|nr:uncharacterized protein PV09_09245 [Verruconis gallopava]KIV99016.1 hypothetical protein PV09_09245 [Verruconis gallopava]